MHYYTEVLKKYAVFTGRATRSEYWYFVLVNIIIYTILGFLGDMGQILSWVYIVATLVPSIAVGVRRLHDTNRSGWWILLVLIPFVGGIVLIVFAALDSDPMTNEYGPNPKAPVVPVAA
jgi:uncharacterized membrane protein YhaH (DUF805 family)